MKNRKNQTNTATGNFDLFRLSKSKQAVDVCPNTLRSYHRQGLAFYRQGKAVFVSRTELDAFIRQANTVKLAEAA